MPTDTPPGKDFEPPKYLASLIAAINDGAKAAQAGMLLFMLVGLYLLATAFSASDEDILLGRTVTISQIGASLPVSFSFALAPLVFVFLHVYALTRYDMLGTNVRYFVDELDAAVPLRADQERCRQLLANVEFVQALTAPFGSSLRSRFWPVLAVAMMAGFPVVVLFLVQINSLRYQSDTINWVQRAWLLIDVLSIVAFFARNKLNGQRVPYRSWFDPATRWNDALLCLAVLVLGLNLAWLNVVSATADEHLVRYDALRWRTADAWRRGAAHLVRGRWAAVGCRALPAAEMGLPLPAGRAPDIGGSCVGQQGDGCPAQRWRRSRGGVGRDRGRGAARAEPTLLGAR